MELLKGFSKIKSHFTNSVVTIGNFDGVHLGHQQIINTVTQQAKIIEGTSIVYTFKPHPHLVLTPQNCIELINTYDEKLELLAKSNIDLVIEEPFSRTFSTIDPERFFNDVLVKRLSVRALYVGYDFAFGKDRAGNLQLLTQLCQKNKVELHILDPLKIAGEICSSSRIRNYLVNGDVEFANKLLGRSFFYRGVVVKGNGRGRQIGFATANVFIEEKIQIKVGVYATIALYNNREYISVTNIGRQPTFNKNENAPIVIETHILDFDADIYGEVLEVQIIKRLRDEKRFESVNQLIEQIHSDVQSVRYLLKQ